ncbi:MAG: hypothetical protein ACT4PL_07295, partial [Phycisphaerales bacterium]
MSTVTPAPATPAENPAPRGDLRPRLAAQAAVMVFALSMLFALLGILAPRIPARIDVTSTREHRLSARTTAVLASVKSPIDLVIAGDLASMVPADRRRLLDLIATFERASTLVQPIVIDTGAADGLKRYDEFLARLAEGAGPQVDAQAALVREAIAAAESAATRLDAVSTALDGLRDAAASEQGAPRSTPEARERYRTFWNSQSAAARTLAADTRTAINKARETLGVVAPPLPVPAVDEAARGLAAPMSTLATGFSVLARSLDQFIAEPASEGSARDRARALAAELTDDRDRAARAVAKIDRLPPLPILSVARAIQRQRAVLLIDRSVAGTVTALETDAIMPIGAGASGGDH